MNPTEVANGFCNFFITFTENIKQSKNGERKYFISSKIFISWEFHSIKIIPINESEIKSTTQSLKPNKIIRL
jgi:hypothetical protein